MGDPDDPDDADDAPGVDTDGTADGGDAHAAGNTGASGADVRHPLPDEGDFAAHLRAGAAVYHAGEFHAAHDAWEAWWLGLDDGPDADLLQGLIQLTAAVHHAERGNRSGASGLAESAREYLAGLDGRHGVAVAPLSAYLADLAADPDDWHPPVRLDVGGETVTVEDLDIDALAVAAAVVAEEYGDRALVDRAVEYAREALAAGPSSPFVGLLVEYVRGGERAVVRRRIGERVERRERRERDVEGLFD